MISGGFSIFCKILIDLKSTSGFSGAKVYAVETQVWAATRNKRTEAQPLYVLCVSEWRSDAGFTLEMSALEAL